MIFQGKALYPVTRAIIHCAAIKTGQFAKKTPLDVFATINRWHTEKGFINGFGYHGFFMPDGSFYQGRPFTMIGAHVKEANRGTLGFLLIESVEITHIADDPCEWFKPYQLDAAAIFIRKIPGLLSVHGHNEFAPKLCPGFKVQSSDWL